MLTGYSCDSFSVTHFTEMYDSDHTAKPAASIASVMVAVAKRMCTLLEVAAATLKKEEQIFSVGKGIWG